MARSLREFRCAAAFLATFRATPPSPPYCCCSLGVAGRLRRLAGASAIALEAREALAAGRYAVRVSGTGEHGRTVAVTRRIRLR